MFARNRQKAAQAAAPEAKSTYTPLAPTSVAPTSVAPTSVAPQWTTAQRVVAQRMQESKQSIPHFYLQTSANAEGMVACRAAAPGEKLAWDAFFVSAVGKALKSFKRMCSSLVNGQLVAQGVDAVGVAVDLDNDLYVIQIVNPAAKSVEHISAEIRTQVQRLRDGDPEAKKVRPSNITISNLGASGVESFTAIVNPPEAAILAVGKVAPQVVPINGQVAIQNRVALTLSVDHRIVNGRYAADFLAKVVSELEAIGGHLS
jgi:pyruvate dehydrogenase E2 component (dihydrolipoamide acetyltransferase)